jgi:DNA-binding GntR family transcriptional regulator
MKPFGAGLVVTAATPSPRLGTIRELGHRTSQEAVKERLRTAILSGELAPGSVVVLSDISEQLGTSKTPVREALRELSGEGLIDFGPFRSPVVHQPTLAEAEEIYQLRLILEPVAVREAVPRAIESDVLLAEELCQFMESPTALAAWAEANRQFHSTLLRSVRSNRLRATIDSLRDASMFQVVQSMGGRVDRRERANLEHRAMLDAYRLGDSETAVILTVQHLQGTIEAIRSIEA